MSKMVLIPVKGSIRVVDLEGLDALQKAVGGMIECPSLPDYEPEVGEFISSGLDLVINDEGKFNGSALNLRASLLFCTNHHGDPIMGDALVALLDQSTGEYIDVDVALVLRLLGDRIAEALV